MSASFRKFRVLTTIKVGPILVRIAQQIYESGFLILHFEN